MAHLMSEFYRKEEAEKKERARLYRLHGITSRKYGGDDKYSWAVLHNGHCCVSGLTKREVEFYKKRVLDRVK